MNKLVASCLKLSHAAHSDISAQADTYVTVVPEDDGLKNGGRSVMPCSPSAYNIQVGNLPSACVLQEQCAGPHTTVACWAGTSKLCK